MQNGKRYVPGKNKAETGGGGEGEHLRVVILKLKVGTSRHVLTLSRKRCVPTFDREIKKKTLSNNKNENGSIKWRGRYSYTRPNGDDTTKYIVSGRQKANIIPAPTHRANLLNTPGMFAPVCIKLRVAIYRAPNKSTSASILQSCCV